MKNLSCILLLAAMISCDAATGPEPLAELDPNPSRPPGSACPGYADPANCPPFPTGGSNILTGTVLERTPSGTTPRANAVVWAWVELPNGNGYSAGSVTADLLGNFRFALLPDARIILQAGVGGYTQPCSSTLNLTSAGAQANIEIVSASSPLFDPAPPPAALTGVVFEETAEGRRPIAGATVFAETAIGIVAATTTSDAQGRYSLCRLPDKHMWITPFLTGYEVNGTEATPGNAVNLDLEMRTK